MSDNNPPSNTANEAAKVLAETLAKITESLDKQIEKQQKQVELSKEIYGQDSNYLKIQEKKLEILKIEKQYEIDINNLKLSGMSTSQEELDILIQQSKEIAKQKDEINKIQKGLAAGESIAKYLGIDPSKKENIFSNIVSGFDKVSEGFSGKIEAVGGSFKAVGMIAGELAGELMELSKKQGLLADQSVSQFFAATGAATKYSEVIYATSRGNTALGISFSESSKAVEGLYTNLNTFTSLNRATQAELTVTAAKLQNLGISSTDTANSIKSLTISMGVTEEQAAKTVKQFAAAGIGMGISAKQMISDFTAVKDQITVFGNSMGEVFIKLQAQSKATGVPINDLLNYANKFDTFEGAATQVGKLNAVLGGPYLSAMSMIEATDPTERINQIREAVNQANVSFESMGYYEKKAIMEAGGFKTVEEAQRILSMSAGEAAEQLQAQQASQQELDNAIQRSIPIQKKLELIMANFAIIMGPAISGLSSFVSVIAEFVDSDLGKIIISIIQGLIIGMAVLAALPSGPIATFVAAIAGLATAFASVHDWLFLPKSPILYDVLLGLGNVFNSISQAAINTTSSIFGIAKSFVDLHDSFLGLGNVFNSISQAAINKTSSIFGIAKSFFDLHDSSVDGIYAVGEAISSIESDKAINMKVMLEKIVEVSEPTNIKGFEQFSEKFNLVAQATAKVDASKAETFTSMLTATQNLSQSLKLNQTVIVKIGDKKFEGAIMEVIDKSMGNNATSYSTT